MRLDVPGGILLAASAAASHSGLAAPSAWGVLLLGAFTAAGFALRITHAAHPFAPPALFRNRRFLAAALIALLAQGAFIGGGLFLTPLLLINQLGLSAFQTGLVIAPGAISVALLALTGLGRRAV